MPFSSTLTDITIPFSCSSVLKKWDAEESGTWIRPPSYCICISWVQDILRCYSVAAHSFYYRICNLNGNPGWLLAYYWECAACALITYLDVYFAFHHYKFGCYLLAETQLCISMYEGICDPEEPCGLLLNDSLKDTIVMFWELKMSMGFSNVRLKVNKVGRKKMMCKTGVITTITSFDRLGFLTWEMFNVFSEMYCCSLFN